jgi:hypothetical protein
MKPRYEVVPAVFDGAQRKYIEIASVQASTEAEALRILRTTNAFNGTRGDLTRLADGAQWDDVANKWVANHG